MPRVSSFVFLVPLLMVISLRSLAAQGPNAQAFPLAKGSYWIYEGEEESQRAGEGEKVFKTKIRRRMEVTDLIEKGNVVAAVVRGYPTRAADELVLVAVDGLQYYLLPADEAILSRLRDRNDELVGLVTEDQIEVSLPIVKGKRFCESEQMTRPDGFYCNVVESVWKQKFPAIRGISAERVYDVCEIAFRTLPDHVLLDFAPGIGITSYEYVHHGTVIQSRLKLVEFRDAAVSPH